MTEHGNVELHSAGGRHVYGVVPAGGGRCHAKDFLAELQPIVWAKYRRLMDRLLTVGTIKDPSRFRLLKVEGHPPVYEMKVYDGPGYRLYFIQHGSDWFVTHGESKPKDNQVPVQVARAREIYRGKAVL